MVSIPLKIPLTIACNLCLITLSRRHSLNLSFLSINHSQAGRMQVVELWADCLTKKDLPWTVFFLSVSCYLPKATGLSRAKNMKLKPHHLCRGVLLSLFCFWSSSRKKPLGVSEKKCIRFNNLWRILWGLSWCPSFFLWWLIAFYCYTDFHSGG